MSSCLKLRVSVVLGLLVSCAQAYYLIPTRGRNGRCGSGGSHSTSCSCKSNLVIDVVGGPAGEHPGEHAHTQAKPWILVRHRTKRTTKTQLN